MWMPSVTETTSLAYLLSGSTILLAVLIFYVGRALWIARREWPSCRTDTKVLYLLVAPPLTLAVDLLEVTDRMFWSRRASKVEPPRPVRRRSALSGKQAYAKP